MRSEGPFLWVAASSKKYAESKDPVNSKQGKLCCVDGIKLSEFFTVEIALIFVGESSQRGLASSGSLVNKRCGSETFQRMILLIRIIKALRIQPSSWLRVTRFVLRLFLYASKSGYIITSALGVRGH